MSTQQEAPVIIVGTGRLAHGLVGRLGASVQGVLGRNERALRALCVARASRADIGLAAVVFVAVSDDAIALVTRGLAGKARAGQLWVHGAGALGLDALAGLPAGCLRAVVHPLVSLSGAEAELARALLVCSGDDAAATLAFARRISDRAVFVEQLDRVRYHAAAALLANGTTALFDVGLTLLREASAGCLDRDAALALMRSALAPLERLDPAAALTGPVRRGDAGVVAAHQESLSAVGVTPRRVYDALMLPALELACAAGLDEQRAAAIRALLEASVPRRAP